MRLLTWNVNHRASQRAMPAWVPVAIGDQQPDLVVLNEYVEGDSHDALVAALGKHGLPFSLVSTRTQRHNQVLIACKAPLSEGPIKGPPLHPAVPPNTLHVVVPDLGFEVLGFRMPAFNSKLRATKREVWEWLLDAGQTMLPRPAVITGDLNTALGDSANYCGDCLADMIHRGWGHAIPEAGFSWKNRQQGTVRRIDHTFLSPTLTPENARYLWDFESMAPDAGLGNVGIPDHAMLVVDFRLIAGN